jgi:Asp-tRNA(Asn)/Glu-tRNA(Gln) amidotransferase A subunit family amidase
MTRSDGLVGPVSLADTVAQLRAGERDLSSWVNDQCDRLNTVEPQVRAFVPEPDRRARLLKEAAALEARYPEPNSRPILYGALVGVKDIINVEGMPTRAGSALPAESFAGSEAAVVTRLRDAGALVLGKTITTEFAYFAPGATANPHDTAHTPGGSSSGSAAAVAAGEATIALGSQTVGSVIRPAAFCGVVGFKATYGRVPTNGVLYYSPSVDHVGLFTCNVGDMESAASIACDDWIGLSPIAAPVLAVPEGAYLNQADSDALIIFEQWLARLADLGLEIQRIPALNDIEDVASRHRALTTAEFTAVHGERFQQYGSLFRARSAMLYDAGARISAADAEEGRTGRATLRQELDALLDQHGIDAWVCPAAPGPAPSGLGSTGNPAMNLPWTHAGVPAITLPGATSVSGLPLGLQLAGRYGQDEHLLGVARTVADLLDSRR